MRRVQRYVGDGVAGPAGGWVGGRAGGGSVGERAYVWAGVACTVCLLDSSVEGMHRAGGGSRTDISVDRVSAAAAAAAQDVTAGPEVR
jgi:hypothetical protein